jgi:hypothetical protein
MTHGPTWEYLYGNRVAIGAGFLAVFSAAIKTMPQPGTKFNAYTWFYDWTHQFLNITNTRLTTTPVITPPSPASTAGPKA